MAGDFCLSVQEWRMEDGGWKMNVEIQHSSFIHLYYAIRWGNAL